MRLFLQMVILISFVSYVSVGIASDEKIITQKEMNEHAKADLEKSNNELTALYDDFLKSIDIEGKNKLVNAEKAWIKYRDLHCEAATHYYQQGTAFYLMKYSCLKEITVQRIEALKSAYQNQLQKVR